MGKTIHIDGSCQEELLENLDEITCQTCPFNANTGKEGCWMNFPVRLLEVIPEKLSGNSNALDQSIFNRAYYPLARLKLLPHHDSLAFTADEVEAMLTFFVNWTPSDEKKAKLYRECLAYILRIMRRAFLLKKGVIIRW